MSRPEPADPEAVLGAERALARLRHPRGQRLTAALARGLRFERLQYVSFAHSVVYAALLICAFVLGGPQPYTFIFGLAHGLVWIGMSICCIVAVRVRVLPLRVAAAVAVLGGIGPFFGSAEFVRERRRRARRAALLDAQ